MSDGAYYSITVAVVLGLAAVLYWTWITPERIPVVGRGRMPRELLAGGIASLLVSAVLLTIALFGVESPKRFLPSLVFAELGITALFLFYLLTVIPPSGSARNVAVQRVWSQLLGGVCLGHFLNFFPRATGLQLPDPLAGAVSLFTMLLSISLCWYSYRFRESLGRTKNAVGVIQLFAPIILLMILRSVR